MGTTRQLFGSLRRVELKTNFKGRQCWRREGREEDTQTRDFLTRFRCLRRAPLFGACGAWSFVASVCCTLHTHSFERPGQLSRLSVVPRTGGILNNLPPEHLQSFDAVTIRPRVAAPAVSSTLGIVAALVSSSSGSVGGDGEVNSDNTLAAEVGGLDEHAGTAAEKAGSGTSFQGPSAAVTTKADGGVSQEEGGMTITVRRTLVGTCARHKK